MRSATVYESSLVATPLGRGKVAIPRLQRTGHGQNVTKDRRRVPQACTTCRSQKTKCTGEKPSCKHCVIANRECVYTSPRKDRLKVLTERCQQMAGLLRRVRSCANADDDARIKDILEAISFQETTAPYVQDTDVDDSRESWELGTTNQHNATDRRSPDFPDKNSPINDPAHATGLCEKSFEYPWLRAIAMTQSEPTAEESDGLCQQQSPYAATNEQVSSYNFCTDNESIEFELSVGPNALPAIETAGRLLSC